jgi:uncharacterized tellurite resistance protein B-like protein
VIHDLDRDQRLHLMKFVCSFAWADLQVVSEERSFVARLSRSLELGEEEEAQVQRWLNMPPVIDPTSIPKALRPVYLAAIDGVIAADGEIAPEERENLKLLKDLLAESED